MKTILLALSFFIVCESFSQVTIYNVISVDDIPIKTLDEVVSKIREELSLTPCEKVTSPIRYDGLESTNIYYCIEDKNIFHYGFKNEILTNFGWQEKYSSKSEAENEFKRKVTILKQDLRIEPEFIFIDALSSKNFIKYFNTPTGDRDPYKIPLFDKEFINSLKYAKKKLEENNFGDRIFNPIRNHLATNIASFEPTEGLHELSVIMMVDYVKEETSLWINFNLKAPFNLNISPVGRKP